MLSFDNSGSIWSSGKHPDAAFRFVEAVEAAVEQLLRMPGMGAPGEIGNPALKGLRLAGERVRRVPYFYVVAGDTVRVIRILHGKLDIDRILGKESVDDDKLH